MYFFSVTRLQKYSENTIKFKTSVSSEASHGSHWHQSEFYVRGLRAKDNHLYDQQYIWWQKILSEIHCANFILCEDT